jgi:hypothetical protein
MSGHRTISQFRRVKKDVGSWAQTLFESVIKSKTLTQKVTLPHPENNSMLIDVVVTVVPKSTHEAFKQ